MVNQRSTRLTAYAETLFSVGVCLFAVLLPLEIVPNRLISLLSLATTALLLPFALTRVLSAPPSWRRLRHSAGTWLVLLLPFVAGALALVVGAGPVTVTPLRTLAVLLLRTWLIAQFAEAKHIRLFERSVLAVGVAAVAFGIFQFIGDLAKLPPTVTHLRPTYSSSGTYRFPRVHSLAREPLLLANYLLIPMFIAALRMLRTGARRRWYAAFLVVSGLLYLSLDSRGAYLALAAALIVLMLGARIQRAALIRLAAGGLLVVAVFLGILGLAKGPSTVHSFTHHAFDFHDASFRNRYTTWGRFSSVIAHNPVVGVGLGNSTRYLAGTVHSPLPPDPPVFNNTYLTLVAELGIVGVLAFLPLAIQLVRFVIVAAKSHFRVAGAAFGLVLVGYAVQATTYEGLLNLRLWGVVAWALAAYRLSKGVSWQKS